MMSSQLNRTSVSGWVKTETTSCVWVCMGAYGWVWVCMGAYGCVWVCMGSFKCFLSDGKTSLTQGHYMWGHNQVLKSLACLLENKWVEVNSLPVNDWDNKMSFLLDSQKSGQRHVQTVLANGVKCRIWVCFLMLEGNFKFHCALSWLLWDQPWCCILSVST